MILFSYGPRHLFQVKHSNTGERNSDKKLETYDTKMNGLYVTALTRVNYCPYQPQ